MISPEEAAQLKKLVDLQQEEIGYLREQLRLLRHKMFGPKSDLVAGLDRQLSMFEETPADSGPIRPVNLVLFRPRFWFIPAGIPMAFRPKLGLDRNPGRNDSSEWPE